MRAMSWSQRERVRDIEHEAHRRVPAAGAGREAEVRERGGEEERRRGGEEGREMRERVEEEERKGEWREERRRRGRERRERRQAGMRGGRTVELWTG
eukprot:767438-Hanusia_phi.AAC.2